MNSAFSRLNPNNSWEPIGYRGEIATLENSCSHETEDRLYEIYLIVRPEEKADVERALECVIPPMYSTFSALGRGAQGGLLYANGSNGFRFPFFKRPQLAVFLPKVVFYLVVPEELTDPILENVKAALRVKGGPSDCGLGIGIVAPIEEQIPIGGEIVEEPTSWADESVVVGTNG